MPNIRVGAVSRNLVDMYYNDEQVQPDRDDEIQ